MKYKRYKILNSDEFKTLILDPIDILINQDQEIELLDLVTVEFIDLIIKAAEANIPKIKSKINFKP